MVANPTDTGTKAKILAKAEELVALHGFESVSLRDITQAAGVNLAAVNYHFGGKDALMEEMIASAMTPMLTERLALLTAAEQRAKPVPMEEIMDAFIRPLLHRVKSSPLSEQLFFKFMGRCLSERGSDYPLLMKPQFVEMVDRFVAALSAAVPSLSRSEIIWRLNFTMGTLTSSLIHGEMASKLAGEDKLPSTEDLLKRLVAYCAAGMTGEPTMKKKSKARSASVALGLLALCFLPSCEAPSPKTRMEDVPMKAPKTWAATKEARAGVDHLWVRRFSDSRLNALVDEALANSPDMKIAAARISQARGAYYAEGAAGNPSADLVFQPSRSKRNFIGFPVGGGQATEVSSTTTNVFDLSIPIQWEIDVFGRIRSARSAARAGVEAAEADAQATRVSLVAEVAKGWFALTEAQAQLALAREAQKTFEETATAVRDRFKGGVEQDGLAAQLRLAETDVATAKAAVEERTQVVSALSKQLEVLVARYPSGSLKGASALPDLPARPPAGLPSELLLRRPDILAAERHYASQGMRIKEAWRALYPRFSLTASGGTSTDDLSNILNSDFGVWQLASNVIQPLFSGGRVVAEVNIREGREAELAASLHKTVLNAFGEVETSLGADADLARREAAVRETSRLAEEALTAANADYRDGVGDILTVLGAQARAVNAKSQLLALRRARLDNRVTLHLALGGDYKSAAPKQTDAGNAAAPAEEKPRGWLARFKKS